MATHVFAIITKMLFDICAKFLIDMNPSKQNCKKIHPLIQILLDYIFSPWFPLYNHVSMVPRKGLHSRAVYDTHMALWYPLIVHAYIV